MRMHWIVAVGLAVLSVAGSSAAQQPSAPPPPQQPARPAEGAQGQAAKPVSPPVEKSFVTHHSAKIGGQTINYTATVGTYVIKDDAGDAKASFFFVGYAKDGVADPAARPVAFSYNGGPGSASLFVHMGFGPKRPVLTPDGHGMPAPYSTTDNEDSFLDATDLVFVDAISTGASRPAAGQDAKQFHGLDRRRELFRGFHLPVHHAQRTLGLAEVPDRRKLRHHAVGGACGRPAAPAPDLSERNRDGLHVPDPADDRRESRRTTCRRCSTCPPTRRRRGITICCRRICRTRRVEQVAQQAREFADGEYAQALMKGDQLPDAERQKVVQDLAHFTALSPKYIEQSNLRIQEDRWAKELERDKRRTDRPTRFALRGHRRGRGGRTHAIRPERGFVRGRVDGHVSGLHPSRFEMGRRLVLHRSARTCGRGTSRATRISWRRCAQR